MSRLSLDIAHMFAGSMVVLSFLLIYQDRITATLNVFAMQAIALSLAVAWQAYIQGAPHLVVTALIALVLKGIVIPAPRPHVRRLEIHADEQVIGGGPTMPDRSVPVALSIILRCRLAKARPDRTSGAVSCRAAVILLGLLMMITRRNAVAQIIGFMSLETACRCQRPRMPLVVGIPLSFLRADRIHRVRHFRVPHPRAVRHGRPRRPRPLAPQKKDLP